MRRSTPTTRLTRALSAPHTPTGSHGPSTALIPLDTTSAGRFTGRESSTATKTSSFSSSLKILPTGNATPLGTAPGGGLYNYVVQTTVERPVDQQALRMDYNITDRLHMFFHGMNMSNTTKGPTDSPGLNAQMQWGVPFFYD